MTQLQTLLDMGFMSIHVAWSEVHGYYVTADDWIGKRNLSGRGITLSVAFAQIMSQTSVDDIEGLLD